MRLSKPITGIVLTGAVVFVMAGSVLAQTGPIFAEKFDGYANLSAMQTNGGWLPSETITDESLATDRFVSAPQCYRNGLSTAKNATGRRYNTFVSRANGLDPAVEPVVWKFWVYDNANTSAKMSCDLIADVGDTTWPPSFPEGDSWFTLGWYNNATASVYQIRTVNGGGTVGTAYYQTTVTRTKNWHEFRVVIYPTSITITIDGGSALTLGGGAWGGKKFNTICMGTWGAGTSTSYGADYDNIQVSYLSDENAMCGLVAPVIVTHDIPLMTGDTAVTVTNVDPLATKVSVYANGLAIGSNNAPGGADTVDVTVSALEAGKTIVATQWKDMDIGGGTIQNVESCLPTLGPVVNDCSQVAAVTVQPVVDAGMTTVKVGGVASDAIEVLVYKYDSAGPTWTLLGSNAAPTVGTTVVTVTPLVMDNVIVATQRIAGRVAGTGLEGCKPTTGLIVGRCEQIPAVTVGMADAGRTLLVVLGVNGQAQNVKVYANDVQIGINSSPGGADKVIVPVTALVEGNTVKATQTISGIEGCLATAPGRRVTAAGVLEDFLGLVAHNPPITPANPSERVWYVVSDVAYTTVSNRTDINGTSGMAVSDPGWTNGIYAVYKGVFPTAGEYHLEAQMWVDERGNVDTDFIQTYEVGVVPNGAHRPQGQILANITTVGKYNGRLTPEQDGVGVETAPRTVYGPTMTVAAGDSLLIALSTTCSGYNRAKTATPGTPAMLIDNIKINVGPKPCTDIDVPPVVVAPSSDAILLENGATEVKVTGLAPDALQTDVYAYTDSPDNWELLGLVGGTDLQGATSALVVLNRALASHEIIVATQTINLTDCTPAGPVEGTKATSGVVVGSGKNSPVLLSLGVRETNNTAPCAIGTDGGDTGNIEWIGPSTTIGGAPQGKLLSPSMDWQTVTFNPTSDPILSFNAGNGVLNGTCGVFEHLAIASTGATSGSYTLYIDNIVSGSTIVEDFESLNAGDVALFQAPTYSGTTAANLLVPPNIARVVDTQGDGSSKSLQVKFQFKDEGTARWVRMTSATAAAAPNLRPNPIIDLTQPLTMRVKFMGVACNNPFADADGDGDVDQADFAAFQACFTGSGGTLAGGCECFDRDDDNDVDSDDAGAFTACASGAGIAADPDCD